ncbi:MAG: non-canonical purine NTP pyrophosphatase [Candidatus Diapherotrites archaeon]|nr:non-canonical purine NTP pyrophosphatase [Candidatus Diapherotrites archaeon]
MPDPLFLVSTNDFKFDEIKKILGGYGVKIEQKKIELDEPDLKSLEEIALAKARHAYSLVKKPLIVEDTGVFFDALPGFPGTKAKRAWLELGFEGLFKKLEGKDRSARFKSVICLMNSPQDYKFFAGELEGRILEKVVMPEAKRLPYEKIFEPDGGKKALVEFSVEEKNAFSHRAIAAGKLGEYLAKTQSPQAKNGGKNKSGKAKK